MAVLIPPVVFELRAPLPSAVFVAIAPAPLPTLIPFIVASAVVVNKP